MTKAADEGLPRVGLVGDVKDPFAGIPSHRVAVDRDALKGFDVLVVSGEDAATIRRPLRRASKAGCAVVVLEPLSRRVGDLRLGWEPGGRWPRLAPAIDPDVANPMGWRRRTQNLAAVLASVVTPGMLAWLREAGTQVVMLADPARPPSADAANAASQVINSRDDGELVERLKRFTAVVVPPGERVATSESGQALLIAAAAGTPVVAARGSVLPVDIPFVEAGDEGVLAAAQSLADDVDRRERASVLARRSALWRHSGRARLNEVLEMLGQPGVPPPKVSVLLASNRPELVEHGIRSVASQRHPSIELVLILHGAEMAVPRSVESLDAVHIVRVGADRNLGEALNAGLDAATGDLVAKMDDDDLYGRDHILDLVLAHEYSRADVVGKHIEHVYLRPQDLTLVRRRSNPERLRNHVSGPTLMLRTSLAQRERFPPAPRRVDTLLLESLREKGGSVYGTHSLDVVLHRHGDNTWHADTDRMLADAEHVAQGLDLTRAASEPAAFSAAWS